MKLLNKINSWSDTTEKKLNEVVDGAVETIHRKHREKQDWKNWEGLVTLGSTYIIQMGYICN